MNYSGAFLPLLNFGCCRGKRMVWSALALGAASFLSGCISPDAASSRIKAFSDATTVITGDMKTALDTTEQKYFDVQVERTVVDYDQKGFQPDRFKLLFSPQTLAVRDAVLDAFAAYGQKLSAIMGNDQLDELDAASKKLGGNLKGLSQDISKTKLFTTTVRPLDDNEVAIVSTAVDGIGTLLIEWKREKSIREAVTDMDTNVQIVCRALTNDLQVLRQILANEYSQGMLAENQFILHGNLDPVTKRAEIRTLAQSVVDARNADAALVAMERTIGNWRKTHRDLLQVFDADKTQIDDKIQQLIADGTRIKAFYDSLQKH